MDARKLVEHLARYPPEPFAGGCAKIALRPFLRFLQLVGAYHEHQYYVHAEAPQKLNQHCSSEVSIKNDDFMVYTSSKGLPCMFNSDQATTTPQSKLFTRTYRHNELDANNVNNINENNKLRRRENISINMETTIITDSLFATDKTRTISGPENILELAAEASRPNSDSFLGKCGLVDKHLTRDMIASLGYDMPWMDDAAGESDSLERSSCSLRAWLKNFWSDRTYSFLILLVHWANCLRCVMYINHESQLSVVTLLTPVLWYFLVAATDTNMFVSCVRRDHFYSFFTKWATIFQDPTSRSLGLRGVLNTRFIKLAVMAVIVVVLNNLACLLFLMIMDDSFSAGMNYVFYITGHRSVIVIAVSIVVNVFTSTAWIGNIAFVVIVCYYVEEHFRELSRVLRLHVSAAGKEFPPAFTLLRERHLAMCENVTVLDRYISVSVGISYSVYITLACFILYQLVKVHMDESVMAINVFWLCCCLFFTGAATYSMANVNVAMHAVSDDLYAIQTRYMTLDQFGQLQMFLGKVNGPSLGFTVFGLITVTREFMLTLFGVYLTYAIVLLQFPEEASPTTLDAKSTNYLNLTSTTTFSNMIL